MNWLSEMFNVNKKAEQVDKDIVFERKVKANDWIVAAIGDAPDASSEVMQQVKQYFTEASPATKAAAANEAAKLTFASDKDMFTAADFDPAQEVMANEYISQFNEIIQAMSAKQIQQILKILTPTEPLTGLASKKAAYELGDTEKDTIKKDYDLRVEGLSNYVLAEMLTEAILKGEGLPERFMEERPKQMKYVENNRKEAEKKLLKLVGEHTLVDWKAAFKAFEEAEPKEAKAEDLHKPDFKPGKQEWKTKINWKETLTDKERIKGMEGVGKEETKKAVGNEELLEEQRKVASQKTAGTTPEAIVVKQEGGAWEIYSRSHHQDWGWAISFATREEAEKAANAVASLLHAPVEVEENKTAETIKIDEPKKETPPMDHQEKKDKVEHMEEKFKKHIIDPDKKAAKEDGSWTDIKSVCENCGARLTDKEKSSGKCSCGANITASLKKEASKCAICGQDFPNWEEYNAHRKTHVKPEEKSKNPAELLEHTDTLTTSSLKEARPTRSSTYRLFVQTMRTGHTLLAQAAVNFMRAKSYVQGVNEEITADEALEATKELSAQVVDNLDKIELDFREGITDASSKLPKITKEAYRTGDKLYYRGEPVVVEDIFLNHRSGDAHVKVKDAEGDSFELSGTELKQIGKEPLMPKMEHSKEEVSKSEPTAPEKPALKPAPAPHGKCAACEVPLKKGEGFSHEGKSYCDMCAPQAKKKFKTPEAPKAATPKEEFMPKIHWKHEKPESPPANEKEYTKSSLTSKVTKEAFLQKLADIESPWQVIKQEDGTEVIARVTPTKNNKESDKDLKNEITSKETK